MKKAACLIAVLLLCGAVAASANDVILKGIDTFITTSDGSTHYSFATDPIPAGFFCKGSAPFSGNVPLKGLPLVTAEKDQLHGADTIVERLDDAAFDRNGTAVTRIQLAALSLVSIEPIQTSCGAFTVYVSLSGPQRATAMHIYKEHERGGTFVAPLAVDARMHFVPVNGNPAQARELNGSFNLGSAREAWAMPSGRWPNEVTGVTVDTNGDKSPDRWFAGSSNFAAGYPSAAIVPVDSAGSHAICSPRWTDCHPDPSTGKEHCYTGCGAIP